MTDRRTDLTGPQTAAVATINPNKPALVIA